VHIDVDLYQPTLDSLEFFWPRLADGGFVVVDDYGSSQFPGATTATNEFLDKNKPSFFYKVPMGACFIIK
jgi:O-methyltransferase